MKCSIYKIIPNFMKPLFLKIVLKVDGGEFFSTKIRNIFKREYGIDIGIGSYGCFDLSRIAPNISIGRYCSFALGSTIVPRREHPIGYASTNPLFFNSALGWVKESPIEFNDLTIGNDVWIGQNAIISSKCKSIGNGAIIGAGSFVNKDVPPYTIVAGVPARKIGERFSKDIIELLEESRWYDLEPNELRKYLEFVNDPKLFARKIMENRND